MILGLFTLSLAIAIQTTSFQNYITNKLIEDINEYELNDSEYKLDISDTSISINGKLVLNSVVLVDSKADTIVSLDKLQSSFFPFFQRNKQFKNLIIEGLKIDTSILNNKENISEIESPIKLNQLSNSIGLESLIINDSDLSFTLNNQLYNVDELNLKFKDISIDNNTISLYVDDLSGLINNSINIEDFESDIILDDQSINVLGYKLMIQDNLLSGDLKLDLDSNSNINSIEGFLNESIVNLSGLNDFQEIPESLKEIKTSFDFIGNKENIEINSFTIDSGDITVNGNGIITNYNNLNVNLNIDEFSSSLENIISIDSTFQGLEIINQLLFKGTIGLNNNKLMFDLNHYDLSQNIQFSGDIDFNELMSFQLDVITNINNNSDLILETNINDIKSNINVRGNISDNKSIDRFGGSIIIDNKSTIDFIGYVKNNYLSSDFNIINNKAEIDLSFSGNIKKGIYKINSEVNNINSNDIIDSESPSTISFNNEIDIRINE